MKGVFTKSVLSAVIILILLFLAIFSTAGFVLYSSTLVTMEQIQRITQSRGRELGMTLATIAAENFHSDNFNQDGMVKLSATMKEIVRTSKNRRDYFEITEIALLNKKNVTIAHNDITRTAKNAEKIYQELKYQKIRALQRDDPVKLEILETIQLKKPYAEYITKFLPDQMLGKKYHMGFAVYAPDEDTSVGRLHIFLSVRSMDAILNGLEKSGLYAIIVSGGAVFFTCIVLTLILVLVIIRPLASRISKKGKPASTSPEGEKQKEGKKKDKKEVQKKESTNSDESLNKSMTDSSDVKQDAAPPGVQIFEAKAAPLTSGHASGQTPARILDAIPLDSNQ